jgi:hypothetical protein
MTPRPAISNIKTRVNNYIRMSVGGPGDQSTKIDKSKKLAEMVLKRL